MSVRRATPQAAMSSPGDLDLGAGLLPYLELAERSLSENPDRDARHSLGAVRNRPWTRRQIVEPERIARPQSDAGPRLSMAIRQVWVDRGRIAAGKRAIAD